MFAPLAMKLAGNTVNFWRIYREQLAYTRTHCLLDRIGKNMLRSPVLGLIKIGTLPSRLVRLEFRG